MKLVVEMEVDDELIRQAKSNKEFFDNLASKVVGDMRRKAFDELVKAVKSADAENV
jgi:hypothetical protein